MIWREKKRWRIIAVQMDNLRVSMVIRRMDREANVRIRVVRSNESVLEDSATLKEWDLIRLQKGNM